MASPFAKVPLELLGILAQGLIDQGTFVTAVAICSFMRKENRCWPSVAAITNRTGSPRRTVLRHIQTLKKLGVLETKRRKRGSSIYSFNFSEIKKCHPWHYKKPNQEVPFEALEVPPVAPKKCHSCGTTEVEKEVEKQEVEKTSFHDSLKNLPPHLSRVVQNARSSQKQIAASLKKKSPQKKIPGDSM